MATRVEVIPPADPRGDDPPLYEATVADTGIDPLRVNVEILGLLANARSAFRRVYNREVL